MRTGYANLPLHSGKAPRWLFERMVRLAESIIFIIVNRYGPEEFLRRISHPVWFQSLGCLLGFDWHSSGLTTTTLAALKQALKGREKELGIFICGGKGKYSRRTPQEIEQNISGPEAKKLVEASRLSAKIDNACVQDGFQLYHHSFIFTLRGKWAVIQQGMDVKSRLARRYHWLSDSLVSFTQDPHKAVVGNDRRSVLNLVSSENRLLQQGSQRLLQHSFNYLVRHFKKSREIILNMPSHHPIFEEDLYGNRIEKNLFRAHLYAPKSFRELINVRGVGEKTLRALALTAEVVYGIRPSFKDPVRYSFAHGGKDGYPFPIDRKIYESTIEIFQQAIRRSQLSGKEKENAQTRLRIYYKV